MISISAIVPAYNAERTIGDCLASVLFQTYPVREVIVIDDGSSDRTAAVARSMEGPIRVLRTANRGVSAARNHGAEVAAGSFLAFLDADDSWAPEKLASQAPALERGARMSTTGTLIVDAEGTRIGEFVPFGGGDQCEALLTRFMAFGPVSSAVIDRQTFRSIGGCSTALQQCADWDLFLRVARRHRIAPVARPLTIRRVHEANMSRDIERLARESRMTLDRFFAEPGSGSKRLERSARGATEAMLAGSYFHDRQWLRSAGCVLRAVKFDPRKAAGLLLTPAKWVRRGGIEPAGAGTSAGRTNGMRP
jgi:glycosyltransferase involved in cell wall biosynthesis